MIVSGEVTIKVNYTLRSEDHAKMGIIPIPAKFRRHGNSGVEKTFF